MSAASPATALRAQFPQHVIATGRYRGQETALIRREGLLDAARWLRDDPAAAFDFLMDLSAVDYLKFGKALGSSPTLVTPSPLPYYMQPKPDPERWERGVSEDEHRFDVVCHLYSSRHAHRLRLRVPVASADPVVDSLTGLWRSADWFEREVWDMFGIRFAGHPGLRRLLMYEEFRGHPLRKDYPASRRQPLVGPVN
jgi:NADH-quinone oxidoreductase subunit C